MKSLVKWVLAPVLVVMGLTLAWPERAEAGRVRVGVHYPGYHAAYVYRHWYPRHHHHFHPGYHWAVPPVRVHVYRPAPVVAYPSYHYVPAPVVVPYAAPHYQVWGCY